MVQAISFLMDNWGSIATLLWLISEFLGKLNKGGVFATLGGVLQPSAQKFIESPITTAQDQARLQAPKI